MASFERAEFHARASFDRAGFRGRTSFSAAGCRVPAAFTDVSYWPDTMAQRWRRLVLGGTYPLSLPKGWCWLAEPDGEDKATRLARFLTSGLVGWVTRLRPPNHCLSGPPDFETEFVLNSTCIAAESNPHFKRYVADQQYVRAFQREQPMITWLWLISSDYGRSLSLWCFWSLAIAVAFAFVFRLAFP